MGNLFVADSSPKVTEGSVGHARANQNITEEVISIEESTKAKPDLNGKNESLAIPDSDAVVASTKTPEKETEQKIEEQVVVSLKADDAPKAKAEEKEKNVSLGPRLPISL